MSIQSRREKEKQARIQSIKNAAWEIFLKEGLHKAKIAEIAKHCSLGLATLYYYFKDKRQIVYALMLDYKMEKHREHTALIEQGVSKKDFVTAYVDSYLRPMDRFRFFVLADSYYNFHGQYDLEDPVIQEYDHITYENGRVILGALTGGMSREEIGKVRVADAMIMGFLRRYALLPRKSWPRAEEEKASMMEDFLQMAFTLFKETGIDLDAPVELPEKSAAPGSRV